MLFLKNTAIFQKTLTNPDHLKPKKINLDLFSLDLRSAFNAPEQHFLPHRTKKRFFWFD
jgi:hypothetical protein